MKNKKKAIQVAFKNQQKYQNKQYNNSKKQSPIKNKNKSIGKNKISSITYYQPKNNNMIYSKKYVDQQYIRVNIDSNQSSTHCSINNRSKKDKSFDYKKINKSKTMKSMKTKQYNNDQQQDNQLDIKLNQNQVMSLINSYAIKIQRQWRRYWFRKCLKFIILKQRQNQKIKKLSQFYYLEQFNNSNNQNQYLNIQQINTQNSQAKSQNNSQNSNQSSSQKSQYQNVNNRLSNKNNNEDKYYYENNNQKKYQKTNHNNRHQNNYHNNFINNKHNNNQNIKQNNRVNFIPYYDQNFNNNSNEFIKNNRSNQSNKTNDFKQLQNYKNIKQNKFKVYQKQNEQYEQFYEQEEKINDKYRQVQEYNYQNSNILTSQHFNHQKYVSLSSINSHKILQNNFIKQKNQVQDNYRINHGRTCSLQQKIIDQRKTLDQKNQKINKKQYQNNYKQKSRKSIGLNCSLDYHSKDKSIDENKNKILRSPIQQLKFLNFDSDKKQTSMDNNSSNKKKSFKIQPKVYECIIIQEKVNNNIKGIQVGDLKQLQKRKQNNKESKKQFNIRSTSILSQSSLQQKQTHHFYEQKYPQQIKKINNMFNKCKKVIQNKKIKNLSSINQKYNLKQITERTYKKLLRQTNDKINKQIKYLQIKKNDFKNTWKQIEGIYKTCTNQSELNMKNNQDLQLVHNQYLQTSSLSFDKWDFQSSAKKSVSNLQSFQDFARQLNQKNYLKNKNYSNNYIDSSNKINNNIETIELVLDKLDKLQNNHQQQIHQNNKQKLHQSYEICQNQHQREEQINKQKTNSFQKKKNNPPIQFCINQEIDEKHSTNYIFNSPKKTSNQQIFSKDNMLSPFDFSKNFKNIYSQIQKQDLIPTSKVSDNIKIQEQKNQQNNKNNKKLATQQSQEESQSQIKLISQKIYNNDQQKDLKESQIIQFNSQQKNQKSQSIKVKQNEKQENQVNKTSVDPYKQIRDFFNLYLTMYQQVSNTKIVNQMTQVLNQVHLQKKKRKQLQLIQMMKYPQTINCHIEQINQWLLEICNFMIKNPYYQRQIKFKLLNSKLLNPIQILQICKNKQKVFTFYQENFYRVITQNIFRKFQQYYTLALIQKFNIQNSNTQKFQILIYYFHLSLLQCLNTTLLDELIMGRQWVVIPWLRSFRPFKKQYDDHLKYCLQKAINKVSNLTEYGLCPLYQDYAQLAQDKKLMEQYQAILEERKNRAALMQVMQQQIESDFVKSNLILQLCGLIYQQQIKNASNQINLLITK